MVPSAVDALDEELGARARRDVSVGSFFGGWREGRDNGSGEMGLV